MIFITSSTKQSIEVQIVKKVPIGDIAIQVPLGDECQNSQILLITFPALFIMVAYSNRKGKI